MWQFYPIGYEKERKYNGISFNRDKDKPCKSPPLSLKNGPFN